MGNHVLTAPLERHLLGHLSKVVRLRVKQAACAVSLQANFISMVITASEHPNLISNVFFLLSIPGNASVPAVFQAVLRPEHERVLTNVPVWLHVLSARLVCHLAKVVRLGVKQTARAVSLMGFMYV